MNDVSQWILIFAAVFGALQIYNCAKFLQGIYKASLENIEIQKQIQHRLTQQINFVELIEGPLHRFLDKKS